jgi:hypothetical protein
MVEVPLALVVFAPLVAFVLGIGYGLLLVWADRKGKQIYVRKNQTMVTPMVALEEIGNIHQNALDQMYRIASE